MVLVLDPRRCQYETGLTITIQQHPLIRALFATLKEAERNLPGVMIPEILREQAQSEMVEALRLNLIQLPEGSMDKEALAEIAKPFADQILRKHAPFHWQAARSVPVQYVAEVMIVLLIPRDRWETIRSAGKSICPQGFPKRQCLTKRVPRGLPKRAARRVHH